MANLRISRLTARPASAVLLRYGLAVSSVAAALGTALIQRHYNSLPRFISHFTLIAIAITFWYAGTGPGLVALLLSCLGSSLLARNHFLTPDFPLEYFVVLYAIFSLLVGWFSALRRRAERLLSEARDNLELRVTERTSELRNALEEIKELRDQLYQENLALKEDLDQASTFEEIVGSDGSHSWRNRDGKGTRGSRDSQPVQALRPSVYPCELRCDSTLADCVGTLWAREGRLHRCGAATRRAL
jgi:hypothetical protein